jgi:hypothetical protein
MLVMDSFSLQWANAAMTSLGFFWMALWAFILGYAISSMIQVFVTRKRMKQAMGRSEAKGILLGTFFGFISSSCSFSALATTRSIFRKGAGFAPSLAFLLASTNLVIELGIVIAVFLSWQFVVGEYLGGLLLIAVSWLAFVKKGHAQHHHSHRMADRGMTGLVLRYLAYIAFLWLAGGLLVHFTVL